MGRKVWDMGEEEIGLNDRSGVWWMTKWMQWKMLVVEEDMEAGMEVWCRGNRMRRLRRDG